MAFLGLNWHLSKPSEGTYSCVCQVGPFVAQWGGDFKRFQYEDEKDGLTNREAWNQYGFGRLVKIPFIGYTVLWIDKEKYRGCDGE